LTASPAAAAAIAEHKEEEKKKEWVRGHIPPQTSREVIDIDVEYDSDCIHVNRVKEIREMTNYEEGEVTIQVERYLRKINEHEVDLADVIYQLTERLARELTSQQPKGGAESFAAMYANLMERVTHEYLEFKDNEKREKTIERQRHEEEKQKEKGKEIGVQTHAIEEEEEGQERKKKIDKGSQTTNLGARFEEEAMKIAFARMERRLEKIEEKLQEREDSKEKRIRELESKLKETEKRMQKEEERRRNQDQERINEKAPTAWTEVIGRRNKEKNEKAVRMQEKETYQDQVQERRREERREDPAERRVENRSRSQSRNRAIRALKRSIPRGAGVLVELKGGTDEAYGKLMEKVQKKVNLEEMGIPPIGIRKARTGGVLLEISCKENEEGKAKLLAERIREEVKETEGATVRCPLRRQRIRLTGVPPGATASGIAEAVARTGGGDPEQVAVGSLRTTRFGAGSVWVTCPGKVALRVAEGTGLTIGWARVGVSLDEGGPPQCLRCLARGHLGRWCPSVVDRGRCCLRCGEEGHLAVRCGNRPHCPMCSERGNRADHRPGDPSKCERVPPGALRLGTPRGVGISSSRPIGGREREVPGDRGAEGPGGDLSPPGASAPSSADPGGGSAEVGVGPAAGLPAPSEERGPVGRLWAGGPGSDSDMEFEEERGSTKRKGQDVGSAGSDDTELMDSQPSPHPLPQRKREGSKKTKK